MAPLPAVPNHGTMGISVSGISPELSAALKPYMVITQWSTFVGSTPDAIELQGYIKISHVPDNPNQDDQSSLRLDLMVQAECAIWEIKNAGYRFLKYPSLSFSGLVMYTAVNPPVGYLAKTELIAQFSIVPATSNAIE